MRVVIDTNIVVSAILRDRTPEKVLRFVIDSSEWEWIASPSILAEYMGVLGRPKFKLPESVLQEWADLFASAIVVVEAGDAVDFPRDPKDAKFLACAIQGCADYFVTGDRDFEEAPVGLSTVICSANQFRQEWMVEGIEG
jgi:uncharacterized protein